MWINYNGRFFPQDALPVAATNIALCYGVSFFETMRWTGAAVPLLSRHLDRLRSGLALLNTALPPFWTEDFILKEIQNTVKRNRIEGSARIRLQGIPELPSLADSKRSSLSYILTCVPCEQLTFNALGISIGIAGSDVQPLPAPFCAFKTGNYLPYFLAQQQARARGLEDLLLLNRSGRIGEAASANVFWSQDGQLFTPPLSEEIVAGVARSHLIEVLSQSGFRVEEAPLLPARLFEADALFLTNAFRGLRYVACCEGTKFGKGIAEMLFKKAFSILT